MQAQKLVLGTAQLCMRYGIANRGGIPERRSAFAILEAAAGLGIKRLDTAPGYGQAESWIGEFLAVDGKTFAITSKLSALPAGLPPSDLSETLEAAITQSLKRLHVDRIDRYLLHEAGDLTRFGHRLVEALATEHARGRIGRFGLSAYTCEEARALLDYPELTVLQHPLNLLDRRLPGHPVFADLKTQGIAIEARSVLLQGALGLAPDDPAAARIGASDQLTRLARLLEPFGVTAVDVALPFVFAAGADSALIGIDSPAQLQSLMASCRAPLPEKLLESLLTEINSIKAPIDVIDPRRWKS